MESEKDKLLSEIQKAETKYAEVSRQLTLAKKKAVEAETMAVEAKINLQRLYESLRHNRNTVPASHPELSLREQEIVKFRQDHPELVEWAKERDLKKGEE